MTTRLEAVTRAGAVLAMERPERDLTAQREGPAGMARRACPGGTDEDRAAIAAFYIQLRDAQDGPSAA